MQMLEEFKTRHSPGKKYLVGVSGGRDSVALVELLREAGYRRLILCHLNHGLRGRESGRDAAFVRRLGRGAGLAVEVGKADVARRAVKEGRSVETAARAARHEFFARLAAAHRCPRVMLAHHADDQVESILMHLFRGAGLEGLEGMRELTVQRVRPARAAGTGTEARIYRLEVIRPLLSWWREDIDKYVAERRLSWREDESNRERAFLRNRVRHELIPCLEAVFRRDVRRAIWRLGNLAAGENAYFRELLDAFRLEAKEMRVARLREESLAVQRRWIRAWLQFHGVSDAGFREIEAVRGLLAVEAATARVNLSEGRFARRKSGKLFLE